jgi:hypothetical protein
LIAAAMAQGKKVLFVAEKLAALEVVKRRLDAVGLGEFCMELHSHKAQKRKIHDVIGARLEKRGRYAAPIEIEEDIARYEELKKSLKNHAERINRKRFLNHSGCRTYFRAADFRLSVLRSVAFPAGDFILSALSLSC